MLVHEAMLYKSANAEVDSKTACQKALLLISQMGLSAEMQPILYERCVSICNS